MRTVHGMRDDGSDLYLPGTEGKGCQRQPYFKERYVTSRGENGVSIRKKRLSRKGGHPDLPKHYKQFIGFLQCERIVRALHMLRDR